MFVCFFVFFVFCFVCLAVNRSKSPPGGNQVNGLPPALRFFDFLTIQSVKCDIFLSEPRSDIGEWSHLGLMFP